MATFLRYLLHVATILYRTEDWVYVIAFNVTLEYFPDGSDKVFDGICYLSECSFPLLPYVFWQLFYVK